MDIHCKADPFSAMHRELHWSLSGECFSHLSQLRSSLEQEIIRLPDKRIQLHCSYIAFREQIKQHKIETLKNSVNNRDKRTCVW